MKALLLSIFFTTSLLTSLGLSAEVHGRQMVDGTGNAVPVPDNPARVIALAPSLTEIVYQLGREDLLKGATQYSSFPEQAKQLPRVGSYVKLDLERIVALQPDLCLAIKDGNPKHTVEALTKLGIPVFVVDSHSIDQIIETTLLLGRLLHAEEKAEALVRDARRRLDRIANRLRFIEHRPRVFFQIDAFPMVSAGRDTFPDRFISLAGGENAASQANGYPHFNWEEILGLQPEVVIVTSMAGGQSPGALLGEWRKWPQIPAVRDGRVHVVEADLFDRPTLRLVDGIERLAVLIHPDLFGENGG
jgi:iron complex transport system substrate-binding protein